MSCGRLILLFFFVIHYRMCLQEFSLLCCCTESYLFRTSNLVHITCDLKCCTVVFYCQRISYRFESVSDTQNSDSFTNFLFFNEVYNIMGFQ